MDSLLAWDLSAFLAINNGLGAGWLDGVMLAFTHLGEGLSVAVVLLCCAFIGDRAGFRRRLIFLLVAMLPGATLVQILKAAVARPRPIPTFAARAAGKPNRVRVVGAPPRGRTSWPSGHSQGAFGAAIALGALFRRLRWPLLGAGALIALSRIYVGAHFPLDVVSGALIGAAGAVTAERWYLRRPARVRSAPS